MAIDLTEAEAQLSQALADYEAARQAIQYAIGDKNLARASVRQLRDEVVFWQRVVRELTAEAGGAESPQFVTPSWT